MKSFSRFLSEASKSLAVTQATRLGLTGDGHGGWYDPKTGEFVAKTEKGKLKFYNKNQKIGQKDPPQERTQADQQPVATQVQPQQEPPAQEGPPPVEKTKGTLTIAFGRFNPPHIGHQKLMDMAASGSEDDDYIIIPSRTQDKKKNPLDADTKISYLRKMFPQHSEKIVNDPQNRTIFDVLKKAHMDGYTNVKIYGGADRVSEFQKLSGDYNGKLYQFDNIEVVDAGKRDTKSKSKVERAEASSQRKFAAEGDFESFKSFLPKDLSDKDAKELYNQVRASMNIKEGWNLWEIAPKLDWKNLRENYIRGNIFKVGQLVENLNTGLIGRIIRRGTNYLICVTEDNIMFKSWIKDVVESETEVPTNNLKKLVKKAVNRKDNNIDGFVDKSDPKVGPYGAFIPQAKNTPKSFRTEWTEVSGVPSKKREVGTDALRDYVMKMSSTRDIKNFINKYKAKK